MKTYTETEALIEIFNSKRLSKKLRVQKTRYNRGKLSQKSIQEILESHNFVIYSETVYKKDI